jgi:transposase
VVVAQDHPSAPNIPPTNFSIGPIRYPTNQPKFNGTLDEIAIYDTALSAPHIKAHYARTAVSAASPGSRSCLGAVGQTIRVSLRDPVSSATGTYARTWMDMKLHGASSAQSQGCSSAAAERTPQVLKPQFMRLQKGLLQRHRCGMCGRRSPLYYQGEGRRRWRGLDLGLTRFFVEAPAPRVTCREHGVVVARVPWARHRSRYLRAFEDQVAWLATQCSQKACSQLMRLDWQTVGRIITCVVEEPSRGYDRLDGLERIGIDEISWRKGQRSLTLVIDHASGRLVWAAEGRSRKVVDSFFELLGQERCARISHVSSDGAEWILGPVEQHCPNATICLDPFHVIQWATNALDKVCRQLWNEVRRSGQKAAAADLKGSRWALVKNSENLTANQAAKLALVAKLNAPLYRA